MGQMLSEGFAGVNSFQPPCCYHKPILQMGSLRLKACAGLGVAELEFQPGSLPPKSVS